MESSRMQQTQWVGDVDPDTPSAARMYDFYLGGSHNFAVDRDAARKVMEAIPDVPLIARANRLFLGRAVTHLVRAGVRQFLDIGAGIPTRGNVHEIAQRADPAVRVVYVDRDPVAVHHSRLLLADNDEATALLGDLNHPDDILRQLRDTSASPKLDLDEPIALLLMSVLHFVPGEEAYAAVAQLRDAMAAGSYLAISHSSVEGFDGLDEDAYDNAQDVYQKTATPAGLRTRAEIMRFFDGFEVIDPGLVWVSDWHAVDREAYESRRSGMLAGVGRRIT
jgi:hypothetical protein